MFQLNQSNLLFTPLYIHELQFLSNKLYPSFSAHGQLHELVFLFLHQGFHFFLETSHLVICRNGNLISALLFFSLVRTVLVQMHMKYVFYNKFSMIIFNDQKTLSSNSKSSRLQMFFKIGVFKNFAIFTGKHLWWIY